MCPYCHTVVSEDTRFCPECGRPLAVGGAVVGEAVKGKSKKKLAGIIMACTIAIIAAIVLVSVKPWERTYTLSVSINPAQAGFVSSSGGEYESGVQVTLTAYPANGYTFDRWSGSTYGTTPIITITMNSDASLTAHFKTTPTTPEGLFSDDFNDEVGVWDIYSDDYGSVSYEDGWLHLTNTAYAQFSTGTFTHQRFTDFVLEVETKLVAGTSSNWHNVLCRWQDADNYYVLDISANGYYAILKWVDGSKITLLSPTYSSDINQGVGAVNLIHIECVGSTLGLTVNGHTLATVTDVTFTGGDIGFSASTVGDTFTEIAFDNVSITGPSETVPTEPEVLFSDDFSDESSGWFTYDGFEGQIAYFNGSLHIKDYATYEEAMHSESRRYFTDFIVEVETWLVGGTNENWQSVACRFRDAGNFYGFGIGADGFYTIVKYTGGNRIYLVEPAMSAYIDQGKGVINLIHIECIGSSLSLSVNGHLLATVTDATFTGGDIGLGAAASGDTFTEVVFDNIVVREP
jgi:hypothetical protein